MSHRKNLGVVLLATMMMSAIVTPVAASGEVAPDAGAVVDAVLLANPELQRVSGPTPTISLTGNSLSATVVLGTDAFFSPEITDLEGNEVFDREIELVRHDSRGKLAPIPGIPRPGLQLDADIKEMRGRLAPVPWQGERPVVKDKEAGVSTVVEGMVDGIRMFEVVKAKNSDHNFSYGISIDGRQAQFITQDDGSIFVGWGNKNEFSAVGHIEAPWAYDANGQPVDVSYKVSRNGTTLTLLVTHNSDIVYPITADPSFRSWVGVVDCSWGGCTFYLERVKTRWIRDTFARLGFALATTTVSYMVCRWLAAAKFAGLGCALAVVTMIWHIQHHADRGWVCLTFREPRTMFWLAIGHVHGSHRYCHNDV